MGHEIERGSGGNDNSGVPAWMDAMRAAVFDAVSTGDMVEITKGIVTKAKGGDLKAADFLFRYLVGNPGVRVQQQVNVLAEGPGPRPGEPSPDQIRLAAEQMRGERKRRA